MASAQELSESAFPDNRLALYTDSGRFEIGAWLRMEHLAEDFLGFVGGLTTVSDEKRGRALDLPPVNTHDYDHEVESWFTPEQIALMYERNPVWAQLEKRLYGDLYEPQLTPQSAG
jgi:hypothetical protein